MEEPLQACKITLEELERARLEHAAFIAPVCHLGTQRQLAALYGALAKAQGEFEPISKNRTGTIHYRDKKTGALTGSYDLRYADLEEITAKTRPALAKHGLSTIQPVGPAKHGGGLALFTQLIHEDGGMIMSEVPLPAVEVLRDMGAAITLLRRYAKVAILDVSADDDLDQNGEQESYSQEPAHQEPRRDPREPRASEVRPVTQSDPDTREPEFYNQTQFQKSLEGWVAAMRQGKSADYIIRVAQSKRKLTDEMIQTIRNNEPQQSE